MAFQAVQIAELARLSFQQACPVRLVKDPRQVHGLHSFDQRGWAALQLEDGLTGGDRLLAVRVIHRWILLGIAPMSKAVFRPPYRVTSG